ncbi:MAG TPA: efflux RND transporter periplasmic adaptor subunit [Candidatus Acidoferrum sp.]|nr:efflux RND transporter periplasmic adaptor subunit [Candidatus Acidoferrum sp.]
MTVPDQDRRARKFKPIAGESSFLGHVLEQTRDVAAADSKVFSQGENRCKVRSAAFWAAPLALFLLPATVVFAVGCGSPKAAVPIPRPEVEVASVIQKDVPIYSEWVATLDGYVNAQIQPQVTGYVIRQTYKEGSFVRKGQILFQIDPRPFQALLDQANAQLAQAQAQLGKTQMDVDRDTPLAKARAIAQSQLDNDVQANRAAQAAVKAAEAQVEQAKLNLEFTDVKSLLDGISGIAQVQIGNLVNPTTVLTSISQINPIKAYFSISEQEYIHFADRINAETQKETPTNGPPFELILADGSVYPHKGVGLLTNRQVDVATGSIQVISSFPNPKNALRPGQFGRLRAAPEIRDGALLVPQKAVTELQGTYQLAVVNADNKVRIRAVKVGARIGPLWIVESGVKPGELVVVEGLQKVQHSSTVKIKQAAPAKGD